MDMEQRKEGEEVDKSKTSFFHVQLQAITPFVASFMK